MRMNSDSQQVSRGRVSVRARLLAVGLLSLIGCDSQPTESIPRDESETIIDFELTPEGASAAQGATMNGMHKLPTVALRHKADESFSASVAQADNSPFDLTYFGGPVLTGATSYTVYVNCALPLNPADCWGTGGVSPGRFLSDLNESGYIRLVNEYIGVDARGRFPVQQMRTSAKFANPTTASLQEIYQILANAVARTGSSGYGAIYHVFLRQGTNVCIDDATCYSPSNPATWAFCAFHGSVNFSDGRHVLFTVEPYQAVDGCRLPEQTPNGVIDATASTLTHELFETITDPDLDGWSNALFGFEISDLCLAFGSNRLMNGRRYFLQYEYSNKLHLCTNRPSAVL
jgi:hypothetical protein